MQTTETELVQHDNLLNIFKKPFLMTRFKGQRSPKSDKQSLKGVKEKIQRNVYGMKNKISLGINTGRKTGM